MISRYRFITSPGATLVTFNGVQQDVEEIEKILARGSGTKIQLSKLYKEFEAGYYLYLRGKHLTQEKQALQDYFSAHFSPPEVRLLVFKGKKKVSCENRFCERELEERIIALFREKAYLIGSETQRKCIFHKPKVFAPGLEISDGVSIKIFILDDLFPRIIVDIAFNYCLNGKVINNLNPIDSLYGSESEKILKNIASYITRSTEDILGLAQDFIKSIPRLSEDEEIQFDSSPINPIDNGMDTWLWAHDEPIELEFGNGLFSSLATSIDESHLDIYRFPPKPLIIISVFPSENAVLGLNIDWVKMRRLVDTTSIDFLKNKRKIGYIDYSLDKSPQELADRCSEKLKNYGDHLPLFVVFSPPKEWKKSTDTQKQELDTYSAKLDKAMRRAAPGAFTITIGWDKLSDENDAPYVIENGLIKGFMAMGAIPWRLGKIPMNTGEHEDDLCFIGIDINRNKKIPAVGGVILTSRGVLVGYHLVKMDNPKNDKVPGDSSVLLVDKLLDHFLKSQGVFPKHVIVHLDGNVEWTKIPLLSSKDIEVEFVEVRKQGAPRIYQPENKDGTPSKDIAVGNNKLAYLINTKSVYTRVNGGFRFPSPDPLTIVRKNGTTPMRTIAAQVYALSCANYTSYRKTAQLPATIEYADALVDNASLRGNEDGGIVAIDKPIYWL